MHEYWVRCMTIVQVVGLNVKKRGQHYVIPIMSLRFVNESCEFFREVGCRTGEEVADYVGKDGVVVRECPGGVIYVIDGYGEMFAEVAAN